MSVDRRRFMQIATGGLIAGAWPGIAASGGVDTRRIRALAFDAFPIFDPRPIAARAEAEFPGQGAALMNAWRIRQFEYQWLRALSGRYVNFLDATSDGLRFAAQQLQLPLSEAQHAALMAPWSELRVWPDAAAALETLRAAGLRLALLSNMTEAMLRTGLARAQLDPLFDAVISTDAQRTYKPDPRAYQMGVDRLDLRKEEILFVAFAGWDVAGAKWFDYPTYWLNRAGAPPEQLGVQADAEGADFAALLRHVLPMTAAKDGNTVNP